MSQLPANRVAFLDEKTGMISRPWYRYLQDIGISEEDITILSVNVAAVASQAIAKANENAKQISNAMLLASQAKTNALIGELRKRLDGVEMLATRPNNDAAIQKLRQRVSDAEVLITMQKPSSGTSSGSVSCGDVQACITCDVIEDVGYWTPVTDGASNIQYVDGEVVVTFVCAE